MAWKKRIVPEHEESYIVCNWCGNEITDSHYTSRTPEGGTVADEEHYHSMHSGGALGKVDKTCLEFQNEKEEKEYFEKVEKEQESKQNIQLTEMEKDVLLNGFGKNEYLGGIDDIINNGNSKTYSWSLQTNCKNVGREQISGVISSLTKKGLVDTWDVPNDDGMGHTENYIKLTDAGLQALKMLLEGSE